MTEIFKYETLSKRILARVIDGLLFIPFIAVEVFFIEGKVDNNLYLAWMTFRTICWSLYMIISTAKYGQTIGKKLMKIKVLSLDEKTLIGYPKAFFRDSGWLVASILGLIFLLNSLIGSPTSEQRASGYLYSLPISAWSIICLISMLTNLKRRGIHDILGGSVVVSIDALKKEELQLRQEEIINFTHKN